MNISRPFAPWNSSWKRPKEQRPDPIRNNGQALRRAADFAEHFKLMSDMMTNRFPGGPDAHHYFLVTHEGSSRALREDRIADGHIRSRITATIRF